MAAIIVKYHFNTDYGSFATVGCKKILGDGCVIMSLGTQDSVSALDQFHAFIGRVVIRLNTSYWNLNYYLDGKRSTYDKVAKDLRKTADKFYQHNQENQK